MLAIFEFKEYIEISCYKKGRLPKTRLITLICSQSHLGVYYVNRKLVFKLIYDFRFSPLFKISFL